jgi:hypothetical protein
MTFIQTITISTKKLEDIKQPCSHGSRSPPDGERLKA